MGSQVEKADHIDETTDTNSGEFDYAHVCAIARIALYDDLLSAPRITEIHPAPTAEFIENLSLNIYEQAKGAGGNLPYTIIREVSENFIHARFVEAIVSILDDGNTIRFTDQGPGIPYKEQAQVPGFTSAIEPMKHYIRGVGSGLPIVKEYLDISHGTITIEDNLGTGAVVTLSLRAQDHPTPPTQPPSSPPLMDETDIQQRPVHHRQYSYPSDINPYYYPPTNTRAIPDRSLYPSQDIRARSFESLIPPLSQRERDFLPIFLNEGALGVTDISRLTGVPQSSTYVTLSKLEESGLIEKTIGQKRILTDLGYRVANSL